VRCGTFANNFKPGLLTAYGIASAVPDARVGEQVVEIAIDTNVLVLVLTNDNPEQACANGR
jgi:hypothetical protein